MDDPRRLLDDSGTDLERRLLQELRSYRSSDETRKRTLAALALTGSVGFTMAGALAWAKTSGAKLLLGVSVASAVVAVPVAYFWSRHRSASPPPSVTTSPPAASPSPTSAEAAVTDGVGTPSAVSPPLVSAPAPTDVSLHASKQSATSGTTGSTSFLRAEVKALDAVRVSLVQGDLVASLSLLDTYFRTYPHGHLQLEAQVLHIEALARAGRGEAARTEATEFLRRNPRSVHAARLQSLLEK